MMITNAFKRYPVRPLKQVQVDALCEFKVDPNYHYERVPCALCDSDSFDVLFNCDRFGIQQPTVICRNCGLVYSNPRLDPSSAARFYSSDLYRKIYGGTFLNAQGINDRYEKNAHFGEPIEPDLEHYTPRLYYDFLFKYAAEVQSVCEIGAGGGWNLLPFQQRGIKTTGIEPSNILGAAGSQYGINLKQGLWEDIDGYYDIIFLKHVFEHLHDPRAFLKRIREHTNLLLIEIPGIGTNLPSIQNAHNYYFSKTTLNALMGSENWRLRGYGQVRSNDYILGVYERSNHLNSLEKPISTEQEYKRIRALYRITLLKQFKRRVVKWFR